MAKREITIMVGGQKVAGTLYLPETGLKNIGALFLHGWTGQPNDHAAQVLMDNGYAALTIAMRGHGKSEGDIKQITAHDSLDDAEAAYDFFTSILGSSMPVIAVGNSYGSYIAVLLSGKRPLAGLSLRVPANYPDGGFEQPKWGRGHDDPAVTEWRHKVIDYTQNQALKLLHDFNGKVQIIEAEKDEIIPHQAVQNYADAVSDKTKLNYNLMAEWPHSLAGDPLRSSQFQEALLTWLNSNMS